MGVAKKGTGRTMGIALVELAWIVGAAAVTAMLLRNQLFPALAGWRAGGLDVALLSVLAAPPAWFVVMRPLQAELLREQEATRAQQDRLAAEAQRRRFEAQLGLALEMAETEQAVCKVLERAARQVAPDTPVRLLLADSSRAHLREEAQSGPRPDGSGCSVHTPRECAAIRRGRPLIFSDRSNLDACPHLDESGDASRCACCVPVAIAGETVGVLQAAPEAGRAALDDLASALGAITAGLGNRLAVLRVIATSELAASRDPLTGLYNRRSLDMRVADLMRAGRTFGIVMADIDHFKNLNDTHGHETGDRSLRVFAQTLRHATRGDDIVARFGGEEFVLVLPDTDASHAAIVVERVRSQLRVATARAGTPAFTASFGIADSTYADDLSDLLRQADEALYQAKQAGRDRAVISGHQCTAVEALRDMAAAAE